MTVKNMRKRGRQKPDHVIIETILRILDFTLRTMCSERVLSKGGP